MRDRGREPVDEAELKKQITRLIRLTPQPVAGYDLVFTPAKSISVLWALAPDEETPRRIEAEHHRAVAATLQELKKEVALTCTGPQELLRVETNGIVAAASDYYDSRAGEPNFHTHVTISTKVQGSDGKWRSLDGNVLFAATVSLSERYNSAIEAELTNDLGLAFEDRQSAPEKRPVREVVGVPHDLIDAFRSRRNDIEERFDQLRVEYRAAHGHEPPKAIQHQLAQQATLDRGGAKVDLESLAAKVGKWRVQSAAVVGEERAADLFAECSGRAADTEAAGVPNVDEIAARVVERVPIERARWWVWHFANEARRQVRGTPGLRPQQLVDLEDQVIEAVTQQSILLEAPAPDPLPAELQKSTGESVFRVHRSEWYSSAAVLRAEHCLLDAARTTVTPVVDAEILHAIAANRHHHIDLVKWHRSAIICSFSRFDPHSCQGASLCALMMELGHILCLSARPIIHTMARKFSRRASVPVRRTC